MYRKTKKFKKKQHFSPLNKLYHKPNNGICKEGVTFQDCELTILRAAIDKAEMNQGRKTANSEEIKQMISIVETFIKQKKLICYGGTAINNILPKQDQFYDKDIEIPDYDFFSHNALRDTKELCDIFVKHGFIEVEGKSGQHHGTFKVFVNFIPLADITFIPKELFTALKNDSIRVGGILYAPPNYLRMSMYLELSRPAGDVSRWEKVLKRLTLLNKNFPLISSNCKNINFQRVMENDEISQELIYDTVRQTLVDQGVVFFGGYAISQYSRYMPKELKQQVNKYPDFDVFTEESQITAEIVKERLIEVGIRNVKIIKHPAFGEIISENYEIQIGDGESIVFIYKPIACHSYNTIKENTMNINIATIDTMLSFYLAFLYANRPYYNKERILCMSTYLFDVQEKNRLAQKGVLRRFSINCIGHQETIEEMRATKAEKYKELKNNKKNPEYDEYFLRYRPTDKLTTNDEIKTKQNNTKNAKTNKKIKNTKTKKNKKSIFNIFER